MTTKRDGYRLSPLQEGMLFHARYDPHSGIDVQQIVGVLAESLDPDLLEQAWQEVLERHPALRTRFCWLDVERPVQMVETGVRVPFERHDWRRLPPEERERRWARTLANDRRRGFDLRRAPAMRLALLRMAEAEYRLLWTSHHAILDGGSFVPVLQEVFCVYQALCRGRQPRLGQPADFGAFLRWLCEQDFSRSESFWRRMLAGVSSATALGLDQRPGNRLNSLRLGRSEDHGERSARLRGEHTEACEELAGRRGLTLNTLVQGAWALLSSRLSGEKEVVFGATRACRRTPVEGVRSMVGVLINTLPVRASIDPQVGLLPWLAGLRARWVEMREHEHTPLVQVQGWSEVPAGTPLFDSLLVFDQLSLNARLRISGGDWRRREFRLFSQTNYPLTLRVHRVDPRPDSELEICLGYDRRRCDDTSAARLLEHLLTLLAGISDGPSRRLGELEIQTRAQRHQLLVEWGDAATTAPSATGLHQLFEAQAARTPESVAVTGGEEALTYRELDRRANRLARHLRRRGIGPEGRVGVHLERRPEMVVALLGILKAGGAYLALDPAYPRERLELMIADAGATVFLTRGRTPAGAGVAAGAPAICLDRDRGRIAGRPATAPESGVTAANLAYVLYTSGSTGRPKGVAIEHRNAVAMVRWAERHFSREELRGVLASTSISFDLSVFELFATLATGGTAMLADSALELPRLPAAAAVTLVNTVPTLLGEVLHAGGLPASVRTVNLAGEPLHRELADRVAAEGSVARVLNLYGPSEDTTYSTWAPVRSGEAGSPAIGRPVDGTRAQVLDRRLQPVLRGAAGELVLGGEGLARGYLARPGLTAERFVPGLYTEHAGQRLYKTGDLARHRPDGSLELLGRTDHQVKLRGLRIEPGEIEAALERHPGVHAAAVVVIGNRLVAYVAPRGPAPGRLRAFLRRRLPAPMVPAVFVRLATLPTTPSGKIDRRFLPAPAATEPAAGDGGTAPRSPEEEIVAGIWRHVLAVESLGIHDDFFALGGHSLLAARVVSRLRSGFGIELPLGRLFEKPTVAQLAADLEAALRRSGDRASRPLRRSPRGQRPPLSFAQQRLWFLHQLDPASSAYNLLITLRLEGRLDPAVLEASLREIARRHEILRTSFPSVGGQAYQAIAPRPATRLVVCDLRRLAAARRLAEAQRQVDMEATRPFDLERGPLWRTTLLRLGAARHALVLGLHHIVADGWSFQVLWRELTVLYQAFDRRRSSPLPELEVQYVDFARWQRQELSDERLESELVYWRRQLAAMEVTRLPADRPRPAVRTHRGAAHPLKLSETLTASLRRQGLDAGASLYMSLLAAFMALLGRTTSQGDLAVGTPVANRSRTEVEGLVGFFVNTLVMRGDLSGRPSFSDLLRRVRRTALEAYAHQDLPFEKLVGDLRPERDMARNPLFQVLFALQPSSVERARETSPGLRISRPPPWAPSRISGRLVRDSPVMVKFDLELYLWETRGSPAHASHKRAGLEGLMMYDTALFDPATIARMAGHFESVLRAALARPLRRLTELPLLAAAERHQLLHEWCPPWTEPDGERSEEPCLDNLLEAQVERQPDAVALVCGARRLTYRGLDRRAQRLARWLRASGVGPEVRVGLLVERSPELVIGLLAILEAGGAYVPMDPSHPGDRLAFVRQDSDIDILLTQSHLLGRLPAGPPGTVVLLDHFTAETFRWRASGATPRAVSRAVAEPRNLAYVIYTSGSTGRPKGIEISRRSLKGFLDSMSYRPGFGAGEILVAVTTIGFDIAGLEILLPLRSGARLVLAHEATTRDGKRLAVLLADERATVLQATPATWELLIASGWENDRRLRAFCGGEALPPALARKLLGRKSNEVWNLYGPTEATIWAFAERIRLDSKGKIDVNLGRVIAGMREGIFDHRLRAVPIGVVGEICLSGPGLARGYLQQPARTTISFVPDPTGVTPGARLYRTGDLARRRHDGRVDYLGRRDHQVKIRGFRIELGEIESVLTRHPGVRQAVVTVRESEAGDLFPFGGTTDRALVGFFTANPGKGPEPTPAALRAFLRDSLPDYMVPRCFASLPSFPLSPAGKVDRRALGAMPLEASHRARSAHEPITARTPSEKLLTTIWRHVLGIDAIGIHDNFFELGGHSLLATQVVSRVLTTFEVALPLALLFAKTTIAELARQIDDSRRSPASSDLPPPIERADRAGELPLSFAQQRLWFLQQLEPRSSPYNIPDARRLRGELDVPALERALRGLVSRHEVLRTVFPAVDGRPRQSILSGEAFRLSQIDLAALPDDLGEAETRRRLAGEAQRAFDLTREPPLRVVLVRLAEQDHVDPGRQQNILFINCHHIASDAWSQGVLRRELTRLYDAAAGGEDVRDALPELPVQYADFAVWQRRRLRGKVLEAQLAYWRGQLAGLTPLELPTDFPRPAVQSYRGARCSFALSPGETRALKRLSLEAGASLFMTLLTAFQVLGRRLSGQSDFAIGSPIASRRHQELEPLIGFFVNTLVLRDDLSGSPSFQAALARTRGLCLEAYAHQDVPFEKLVEELDPERDLSRSTLFQVMLTLQNNPTGELRFRGLETSDFSLRTWSEHFDLSLAFEESGDRLSADLSYNTDLFQRTTVLRWARHLETLLRQIGRITGDVPVSELPVLPLPERHQLLLEWNDTEKDRRLPDNVAQLIDEQIERTPDAVAVVFEDRYLSFAGLRRRALRLSFRLRGLGAGPETLVGLMIPRSIDMIVALLAVTDTGAAWVALDPELPDSRLELLIGDLSQKRPSAGTASLVLTRRDQLDRPCLDGESQRPAILDAPAPFAGSSRQRFSSPARPRHAAYMIHTSGSTGRPKGTVCTQEGILHRLRSWQESFTLDGDDAVLHKTALSFDVSIGEILWPLASGARLVVTPPQEHRDPFFLLELIRRQRVTTVELVPSMLHALLDASYVAFGPLRGNPQFPPCLRQLMAGGEALTPDLQARLHSALGDRARLHNTYGPAEATIDATWWPCEPRDAAVVPIGRPIAQLTALVLDRAMVLQPLGGLGELHLGGPQLARGYAGMPARTAHSFVPHPFAQAAGDRLYKSGDLCRWAHDGQLDFLGRRDHQVKIRGHRIEIGEVEAALAAHPLAGRAAVIAVRPSRRADLVLAGYVTPASPAGPPRAEELRSFLAGSLPQTMVPATIEILERIPLTASGKVDRAELERCHPPRAAAPRPSGALRTPTQEMLIEIWEHVLEIRDIGVDSNFFALGGHSLLASQVVSRVRRAFEIEMPLRLIFEKPTPAELAAYLDSTRRAGRSQALPPPIRPVSRDGELPLSFAQQRLWFLQQLEPQSSTYSMPEARRLDGELAAGALERAFRGLVRRHEVLRTVFPAIDGRPHQRIVSAGAFQMTRLDLTALPVEVRETEARRRLAGEAWRPFDLTRELPLRVVLVRLAARDHILFTNPHHIVSDGWSYGIFERELTRLYEAAAGARDLREAVPDLPIQYADFAVWQRRWLRGEVLEAQLAYWRRQLAGLAPLELPIDRPRPAAQTYRGAAVVFTLSCESTQALKRLSLEAGTSLFMTLLTAFQILAQRLSGQSDFAVGSAIANRHHQEIEPLIGFFVNTLVLRGDVPGSPSLDESLARTRRLCLEAYAHQDLPFEKLVEELEPERDLSRSPLFQVMLILQNAPADKLRLGPLEVADFPLRDLPAHFDLTLTFWESDDRLVAHSSYNADLFDRTTILRWSRNLEALLTRVGRMSRDGIASELSILTPQEHHQVLAEWNDAASSPRVPRTVVSWFEEQVAETPDAAAVAFSGSDDPTVAERWLSYRELDARATRLARTLVDLGIGRDSRVALCLDRSLEMIVALLGILKSGAAYVPLDPSYPAQRLAFMLEETHLSNPERTVLLARSPLPGGLRETADRYGVTVVRSGRARSPGRSEPLGRRLAGPEPSNLAYVIYTSGSTGRPKGIALSHQALWNLIDWHLITLLPGARALQYASVSFDASFHELFAAWCSGGCLFMISDELRRDVAVLARFLERRQIEKLILPVVVLHRLAEESLENDLDLQALRELTATGEQLLITHPVSELFERFPRISFHNHYGPSETHVVTAATLRGRPSSWPSYPSIGRPISRTEIHLLDHGFEPVSIGCTGELYIGGMSLGRGYLGRPALTAERFVPDALTRRPGSRLYRSGDHSRWLPDGTIDFLGRIDLQVKIRGFRVEVEEIEAALTRHPGVCESAVIVVSSEESSSAERWLAGFVVPDPEQEREPTARELRAYLGKDLPDYMVPGRFASLPELPLSPTGKVDRKALGAMRLEVPGRAGSALKTTARTPSEEILAAIWQHVLGVGAIGVHDNFFELGGHSLLATQVVSRVRKTFEVELPVAQLFAQPTIAGLARRIDVSRRSSAPPDLPPPIEPAGRAGKLPLSFAQQRLWFLQLLEPQSSTYNIAQARRLQGELDVPALERALRGLVRRHEVLRTVFPAIDGSPHQSILSADTFQIARLDLAALPENVRQAEARRRLAGLARRPFDLTRELPLRVVLVRLAERDQVDPEGRHENIVFTNSHHVASDGWSQGIFNRELTRLYESAIRGTDFHHALPDLPIQYADFAVWQRGWLQGEILESQLEYWREQLAGLAPLELPTDRPRPTVQTYRGAGCSFTLSPGVTCALKRLSLEAGASLFMTLLTAFQILAQRLSGQSDLAIGSPIANRHHQEIEPLVGFFVNTLVLRGDLSGSPSFQAALARTKRLCLEAYARQDVPFEKLVEELDPERDLSRSALFQVMLTLQNTPRDKFRFGDLETSVFSLGTSSEHFDLSIAFEEIDDRLLAHLSYSTDLFHRTTILRWARNLATLLKRIGRITRDAPVSELSIFTLQERHQLLFEWNDTEKNRRLPDNVSRLIDEQIERAPDAVAVVSESSLLSFACMRRRALRLSLRLRDLGAGPETLAGLMIPRSIDMIVALLAVTETGAAWVALDPELPDSRLERLIGDLRQTGSSAATRSLIVTRRDQLDRPCLEGKSLHLVVLDTPGPLASSSRQRFSSPARPFHAAYLIHTSGSTGRPKGTVCTHEGILHRLRSWQENFTLDDGDVVLHKTAVSFDVSIGEILWPLISGARLVVTPQGEHRDPFFLLELVRRQRVTTVELVPSMLHALLDASNVPFVPLRGSSPCVPLRGNPAFPPSLRQLMAGGEALTPDLQARLHSALGDRARLHNTYGPAEATIDATWWPCRPTDSGVVPIGRPISQMETFVLDHGMRLQPLGGVGELHLGGPQLARGYAGMPSRTARSFIPHPFADVAGERLYKTGDLCRWTFDGQLDFRGRCDHQVKIRGHRIEIGEVEAALAAHPLAGRTVVIATRLPRRKDLSLVGYVTPASSANPPRAEELRSALVDSLPPAMVPFCIEVLEQFPLTANGKIDRAEFERSHPPRQVEPRPGGALTPTQEMLIEIWEGVLEVEGIGVDSDFFALGGHSLLATQVTSRVRRTFEIEIPLRLIFERPTLVELARHIDDSRRSCASPDLPPRIEPAGRPTELPLRYPQERLWFLQQLHPERATFNMPDAWRLKGELDVSALQRAFLELVRRHEVLRTVLPAIDGRPCQRVLSSDTFQLTRLDLTALPVDVREAEARRRLRIEARRPYDLTREPPLRVILIRLAGRADVDPEEREQNILFINSHHIASDGWSEAVFGRELDRLYKAATCGEGLRDALPDLPIQYADFAFWQRRWLQGEVLETQLTYWREQLAGFTPLELPTDRPRPTFRTDRGGVCTLRLCRRSTQALKRLGFEMGASLFMTLLTAFQILAQRLSGQHDFTIGSPIANRHHPEIEGLIGFFTNLLVLRSDLSGAPSFHEVLARTRSLCLAAYAHQHMPFEKLVEELVPERDPSRSPLFQVDFILQNTPPAELRLGPLETSAFPLRFPVAYFDLMLSFWEADGRLSAGLSYNRDLFDHTTIVRWTRNLERLLKDVARIRRDKPVSSLSIFEPSERHQCLVEWAQVPGSRRAAATHKVGSTVEGRSDRAGPRDPIEKELAEVWVAVLGIEQVGMDEDFFALGGDSLLAVWLMTRIERRFGIVVPLTQIFLQPTVAGLAEILAEQLRDRDNL